MADGGQTGLLDLEKELSCSICTEVLFQPLTLLDCLHTFCGSCLKEWFSWQVSQVSNHKPSPYTCPSCRASVRETRPNATVTTLLDMYLKANPERRRSKEEEDELKLKYKPGEQVLPRVTIPERDLDDERMLAEVREMSLREVGVRAADSYERGTRHRTTERRRGREEDGTPGRGQQQARPAVRAVSGGETRRQMGHQSSLRSLMSSSDIDSSEMEEEILRLVDEGWLDGIDLNTLDTSQVDELSERIADAYRRRHRHQTRVQSTQAEHASRSRQQSRTRSRDRSRNRSNRQSTGSEQPHQPSRLPVSRPHLLEAYPTGHSQQRRASSEQRRQTSPSPRLSAGRTSSGSQSQASRSATDLSERPSTSASHPRPAELTIQNRRTTDPEHRHMDRSRGDARSDTVNTQGTRTGAEDSTIPAGSVRRPSGTAQSHPRPDLPPRASDPGYAIALDHPVIVEPGGSRREVGSPSRHSASSNPTPALAQNVPILFTEPSIECNRCGRQSIQYTVHWHCSKCHGGKYNICLQCYRHGRGCLHWYGFGYAALQRFHWESQKPLQGKDVSPSHALIGRRYKPPEPATVQSPRSEAGQSMTTQDPSSRLETGAFCAICLAFADDCFWKCSTCNDGEWGFCTQCVSQGRCCTHPLLPVAHKSSSTHTGTDDSLIDHLVRSNPHLIGLSPPDQYVPFTINTNCNICSCPIQHPSPRFHCPQCNKGDFNICTDSYLNLVSTKRISLENSDKGWRRCPSGHRMLVIAFEDTPGAGQRRVIVKDVVGGHALKNDGNDLEASLKQEWSWQDGQQRHIRTLSKQMTAVDEPQSNGTASAGRGSIRRYPPSGGQGMEALALWSYWPREEAQDELAFPKSAEIREVENINGDWFLGYYAGRMGLFPGNYVRVLDTIRS